MKDKNKIKLLLKALGMVQNDPTAEVVICVVSKTDHVSLNNIFDNEYLKENTCLEIEEALYELKKFR